MRLADQLQKERKNPFHFYIITGNSDKNKNEVFSFLENDLKISTRGNADFYEFSGLNLPISDARKIKSINATTKYFDEKFRILFINVKKIDVEAQNALLKTLEEPANKTIFFLLVPNSDFLLDTVLSRGRKIIGEKSEGSERAKIFLQSSFLEREKMVLKISKISKESSEVRNEYLVFLTEIENEIVNNKSIFLKKVTENNFSKMYREFLRMKEQAEQKGSGLKYIMIFLSIELALLN